MPTQAENYLVVCQRYIELNPVRAEMVSDPANYRWRNYWHHALRQPDPYLTLHPLYFAIAQSNRKRQVVYRASFGAAPSKQALDELRLARHQNQPLGNSRFYAKFKTMTGQRREARPRGRPRVHVDDASEPEAKARKTASTTPTERGQDSIN